MLTLVETISLAGDRAKQNDDTCGSRGASAWVIDGATDLHDAPLTKAASDAAWIAHYLSTSLHSGALDDMRAAVRRASEGAAEAFAHLARGQSVEGWQSPIASLLMVTEDASGALRGLDIGDCRAFALDAEGAAHQAGGIEDGADHESQLAAKQTDAHKPLLRRTETIEMLRRLRASQNGGGNSWTFCLDPACADQARAWELRLARPAHVLLCTDGFSALVDRYAAYDPGSLVKAALERGLQELGRNLRAIEAADSAGAKHPRFKRSDDATALLLRLA